jgi:hypothetical protein
MKKAAGQNTGCRELTDAELDVVSGGISDISQRDQLKLQSLSSAFNKAS